MLSCRENRGTLSSKKDKFLESAQKFIAKGQIDRAIKDYEQVVALDPNDIRHRQRLAELLVRVNRTIEAIGEYEAIGKYYADNGFYLKAIAVYKQIQKIEPNDIKTCITLASLNEKQGLTGNALTEYGRAFSYFDKNGKHADALKILETMIAIDPDNLNTRLKFAETRYTTGSKDQAYEEFSQIAVQLKMRGDESAFGQVSDRIRRLFPDKKEFTLELLASEIEGGNAAAAIPRLLEMTKKDQANPAPWNLLLAAYRATGARAESRLVLQKMVRTFPDDLSVKEGLIQTALDDADPDEVLNLLRLFSVNFVEKGDLQTLERIYLKLLELSPYDVRVLQGMKKLYESSGDEGKCAAIVEKIESLSRVGAGSEAKETKAGAAVPEAPEPQPVQPAAEYQYGEGEIPLSLEESDHAVPYDLEAGPLQEEVEMPAAGVGYPEDEPELSSEIDLELEIYEEERPDLAEIRLEPGADRDTVSFGAVEPDESPFADQEDPAADRSREDLSAGGDEDGLLELSLDDYAENEPAFPDPENEAAFPDYSENEPAIPGSENEAAFPGLENEAAFPDFSESELEFPDFSGDEPAFSPGSPGADAGETVPAQDKYGTDGLFSAFKKGLDQQLEAGDTETRYNLGIAFKEMGLYDEAIAEFRAAALDPARKYDCIALQGICCREKGDYGRAEGIFKEGLAQEGISPQEVLSIKYELALLYESAGRPEEALGIYLQIQSAESGFRDIKERVARLQGNEVFYDLDLVELENEE